MSNTYLWNFTQLGVYNQFAGQEQVVYMIHWTLTGTSDTDPTISSQVYGSTNVTYAPGEPFTPYDNISYDQVVQWVETALGDRVDELRAALDQQIQDVINPPTANLLPPWQASPA